jgi:type I restriction enzyme M protein
VLCSGNLYIIRPDRDRVDPIYLKLFLDSPLGQAQLRRISSGTSVLTIPIRDLKDLRVPLVPMEEQKEIAAAYAELADELRRCRRRIERTRAMMGELFPLAGQR